MLSSLANHPLLQTDNLMKVIQEIEPDQGSYLLAGEVPIENINETRITVDVRTGAGGMTQMAQPGAESPTVSFYGNGQWSFDPAEFREKVILTPKEMYSLRKLGTKQEVEAVQAIIARHVGDLRMRLETRMEWLRWQVLFGQLTITQKDLELNLDYKIPSDMKPTLTGGDLWSASTADPMDDVLEWLEKFRDISANADHFAFNGKTHRQIMQNAAIRDLRDAFFTGQSSSSMLNKDNMREIFKAYCGIEYKVYDGGYSEITDLTSAVASAGTSLVVRDIGTIAVGDSIHLIHKDTQMTGRVRCAVTAVVASTKTITIAAPGANIAYPAGSRIHAKKFFIPDSKFIIRGKLPPSTEGGTNWASIISTLHPYGANPMVPTAGIFAKTNIHDKDDPPKVELIAGFNGAPVMYHPDTNLIATVL